ncbi:MAG: hypothetical protein QM726_01080 [Chitinophagaceae bacterium]
MKQLLFVFTSLCFSIICAAQNIKTNQDSSFNKNIFKVSLLKETLSVTDKDQPIPITSLNSLDSLIKKLSFTVDQTIHFESVNADPEKVRAITTILNKCNCHVTAQHVKFDKQ